MKLKGNGPFKPLFNIWSSNIYSNTFQSPADCNSSESFNVTQKSILTDVVCLSLKVFQKNACQMHPIYGFIKFQIHRINISRCSLLLFYFFLKALQKCFFQHNFERKLKPPSIWQLPLLPKNMHLSTPWEIQCLRVISLETND